MFKISIVETDGQRRLVLAGKLVSPWTTELETAWLSAAEQLRGRKLVVDLTDVTVISPDGENTLFKLMKNGAQFSCDGVLTRHVLKQLARRCQCGPRGVSGREQLEDENLRTEKTKEAI
jgi:anti-anti-sigma regulatory factor